MKRALKLSQHLLEQGLLPDFLIRFGIQCLLKEKLKAETRLDEQQGIQRRAAFVQFLKNSPIAINTKEANGQHYELPTAFFRMVMGKHMKYSCGLWKDGVHDLTMSEEDMLELTASRAEIQDGQSILELGCGWGSLTLWMATHFPHAQIVGVSNSRTQREYILRQAKERNLKNVRIVTADMNDFNIDEIFDRVVSVEMFEHMRNYKKLLAKIADFLKKDGKLFVHIFTHHHFAYCYDEADESDWIAKYFFTGGIMPSDGLLIFFQDDLTIEERWTVNGRHYQKTSEVWLKNMDQHKDLIMPIFKDVYGRESRKWWVYWRVFFMSCAELWGYAQGREWMVSHYRFVKKVV